MENFIEVQHNFIKQLFPQFSQETHFSGDSLTALRNHLLTNGAAEQELVILPFYALSSVPKACKQLLDFVALNNDFSSDHAVVEQVATVAEIQEPELSEVLVKEPALLVIEEPTPAEPVVEEVVQETEQSVEEVQNDTEAE